MSASPRKPLTPIQGKLGKLPENEMVGKKPILTRTSLKETTTTATRSSSTDSSTGNNAESTPASRIKKIQSKGITKKKHVVEKFEKFVQTDNPDIDLITGETAPIEYWKQLAEERRVALEEALKENQQLTEQVESLEEEKRELNELLDAAKELADMVRVASDEAADESGIGVDSSFNTSI